MAAAVSAHGGALKLRPSRRLFCGVARPPPPPHNRFPVRSELRRSPIRPIRPSTAYSYNARPPCPSISHSKNAWIIETSMLEEKKLQYALQQLRTESNDTQPSIDAQAANGNLEKSKYDPVKEQEAQDLEKSKYDPVKEQEAQEEYIRNMRAQEEKRRGRTAGSVKSRRRTSRS